MKYSRLFLTVLMMTLAASAARAEMDFGALLGFRHNSASTDIGGASVSSRLSYIAGVLGWVPLRRGFGVRSGVIYNQRYVNLGPTNQGDIDIQFSYLDIPLTATYQFNNAGWIFAGPVLGFNQSKDVACSRTSNCSAADVKSFILPWQLGIDFKFMPQVGGEFFYEFMSGDLARNVSEIKAIGLGLLIFFD